MAASELHRAIDVGHAADPVLDSANGVEEIRDQEQIDEKPRGVLRSHGLLAQRLGEGKGAAVRLVRRGHRAHHLDELHQRDRVEEVESDESVAALRGGGHRGDREARCVRGEDGATPAQAVELVPEGVLELEVFGHRLENDVAPLEVAGVGGEAQPLEGRVPVRRSELPLLDELGE